ncbi:uncharacterized protein LOC143287708 [Babylonia areolata]|uniref:uncharacterized protein LOC143287708 n=1 Tax=Babylonia areolata TaxID=304850 RepID=UPI003FCF45E6
MAVDRRSKPYYYLSCADVDDKEVEVDEDAPSLKDTSREDIARLVISILCKTEGRATLGKVVARKLRSLKHWNIDTPSALLEFCRTFPQCFAIRPPSSSSEVEEMEVEVTTEMNLCSTHLKKTGSCPEDGECGYLHLCRFFMLAGKCDCGSKAQIRRLYGHQLHSDHNHSILRHYLMDHLSLKEVQTLVRRLHARILQTRPFVCRFYNQGLCKVGPRCICLHLCKRFVFSECKYGEECLHSHDLTDSTVKSILEKYAIPPEELHLVMKGILQEQKALLTIQNPTFTTTTTTPHTAPGGGSGDHPAQTQQQQTGGSRDGERDEARGGHWCPPMETASSRPTSGGCTALVSDHGDGGVDSALPLPAVYSTVFSRRRGHVVSSGGDHLTGVTGREEEEQVTAALGPTPMNPFSYVTVRDMQGQADTDPTKPAGGTGREDAQPAERQESAGYCGTGFAATASATLDCSTTTSRKAEGRIFGQSHDSNFIPLKPADKNFTIKLTPGRPVASVPPQIKIKPELGICRKMDMIAPSSGGGEFDVKKMEKSGVAQEEWSVKTESEITTARSIVSSDTSSKSSAESLQNIISGLIDNVKKLHAKTPGPELHLMQYLSELAQPDKLKKEMKAAEDNERREGDGGAGAGRSEKYLSDGEISDSDHEMEEVVGAAEPPTQEKVLFDYNHRPTVDLISDMLNSRENSPCQETLRPHTPNASSSVPHRLMGTSSCRRKHNIGGKRSSVPELRDSLEEISSANSAVSDIMSSEEDPPDSGSKTTVTSKGSVNVNKTQVGISVKLSESSHIEKGGVKALADKSDNSGQQTWKEVTTESKRKLVSTNVKADEAIKPMATPKDPDRVKKKSEEESVARLCHSRGARSPNRSSRSSSGRKSPGSGRYLPGHRVFSPGRKSSDLGPPPADHMGSCGRRTSPNSKRRPASRASPSGATKSPTGSRRSSPVNRKSSPGNRRSIASRKSPGNNRQSDQGSTKDKRRTSSENKRSEDPRKDASGTNRSSERRRSSDAKRVHPEDKSLASSPRRSSTHHSRSSVSPRRHSSSSRGHMSNRPGYNPGYRKTSRSPDHKRFPQRTESFHREHHRQSPSSGRHQQGAGRSDNEHDKASSGHRRATEIRRKDWNDNERGRMSTDSDHHRFRDREKSNIRKDVDDQSFRSREEVRMEREQIDDRRVRGRSEREQRSVERNPKDRYFDNHSHNRSETHSRHSGHDERRAHSPSRDRTQSHSADRRWESGRMLGSPFLSRHRFSSHTDDSRGPERHRQRLGSREGSRDRGRMSHFSDSHVHTDRGDQWPVEEEGFFQSEGSLDVHSPRNRDGFFHREHTMDNDSRRQPPPRREFRCHSKEKLWNGDDVRFDRSPSRDHGVRKGSLRKRLGPSPVRFGDRPLDDVFPESERDWDDRRSHGERHYSEEVCDINMESCERLEGASGPFCPETGFDREMDRHGDLSSSSRYSSQRMFSKHHEFGNYEERKKTDGRESSSRERRHNEQGQRDVILRHRAHGEERDGWQGPSHSPERSLDRARHDRSAHHSRSSQAALHAEEDSRDSLSFLPESERLALREQIDDLLDKARHSNSRGASPFQGYDENAHVPDISYIEGEETDGRPDLEVDFTDRSPEHHCVSSQFRSQQRSDSHYHRAPSKRPREPLDSEQEEQTFDHKRRRVSRGRGHPSRGHRSWNKNIPGREPQDSRDWNHNKDWEDGGERFSVECGASIPRGSRGQRSRGQNRSNNYRNTGNYHRGGLKIKMVFNHGKADVQGDEQASYHDLDQPHPDEVDVQAQMLDAENEEGFYGERSGARFYGDPSLKDYEEDADLSQGFHDTPCDVGDMIEAQKARVMMKSDLRNLLKTKRGRHFSEPDSEHIKVRVRRPEKTEHFVRNKYVEDEGREVIFAEDY